MLLGHNASTTKNCPTTPTSYATIPPLPPPVSITEPGERIGRAWASRAGDNGFEPVVPPSIPIKSMGKELANGRQSNNNKTNMVAINHRRFRF